MELYLQWISEVLHFCQGLPIILVGCKKDLRYDQKTIEELHKTSQKPVTPEQVRSLNIYHRSLRYTRPWAPLRNEWWLGTATTNEAEEHQLTNTPTGRGSQEEDRRETLPRMFCENERRCEGGIRARDTLGIALEEGKAQPRGQEGQEVHDPVKHHIRIGVELLLAMTVGEWCD